jgi:putative ABC transport system ATP-binding protein
MSVLQVENLTKTYGSGPAAVHAVREMSLSIRFGEFVAVMGQSGSGKSTLLSILGGLNTPTLGSYRVDEIDVYALGVDRRADFRREYLGFIFQSFHLIPYLSLAENVMLPLATTAKSGREKRALAEAALERVGLGGKSHRLPAEVSGGEAERAAIARAIVNAPPVLLADEPTGNLDTRTSAQVMDLLEDLNDQGMTVVMVTHSPQCARHARRILHVSDGRIEDDALLPRGQANAAAILSSTDAEASGA